MTAQLTPAEQFVHEVMELALDKTKHLGLTDYRDYFMQLETAVAEEILFSSDRQ